MGEQHFAVPYPMDAILPLPPPRGMAPAFFFFFFEEVVQGEGGTMYLCNENGTLLAAFLVL